MAVSAVPVGARFTLRLNTGLDENLNPVFRNRSWHNVKPNATHDNVHLVAGQLASLQIHTLESIRRIDENELEEE